MKRVIQSFFCRVRNCWWYFVSFAFALDVARSSISIDPRARRGDGFPSFIYYRDALLLYLLFQRPPLKK